MDGSAPHTDTVEARMLTRMAARACELAEDLADAALAAETPQEKALLTAAFQKANRAMRQNLALKMKLIRDEQAFFRDFAAHFDRQRQEAVARRRETLHDELERVVWDEYEACDAEEVMDDVLHRLERESKLAGFLDEPLDRQLARLKAVFAADFADEDEDEDGEDDGAEDDGDADDNPWNLPPDEDPDDEDPDDEDDDPDAEPPDSS